MTFLDRVTRLRSMKEDGGTKDCISDYISFSWLSFLVIKEERC